MGHVQVPAVHHRLCFVQTLEIVQQIVLPLHAVADAGQLALGVGGVAVHQPELGIFQGDEPPLVVMLLHIHAVGDGQGLRPGKNGGARVSLLVRRIPELMVTGQLHLRLPPLHFGLLEADKIGVQRQHRFRKPFFQAGPQAVHVPGHELHTVFLLTVFPACSASTHRENTSAPSTASASSPITNRAGPRRSTRLYFSRR